MDKSVRSSYVLFILQFNNRQAASIAFKDKNGDWVLGHWETVWSKYGSADGFYWPYYR